MPLVHCVWMLAQISSLTQAQEAKAEGVRATQEAKFELAERAFGQACQLAPKLSSACFFHGRVLYYLNRFTEALPELQKSIDAGEPPGRAYSARAQCLEALGQSKEAEAEHRKATAASPETQFLTRYALFLYHQGRPRDCLELLDRALAADPDDFEVHLMLGRALLELDRVESALEHLETALRARPSSTPAHLLAAKACQRLGSVERAQRHLDAIQAPEP